MQEPRRKPAAAPATSSNHADDEQQNELRLLSRSPHPYRRLNHELLEPSDRVIYSTTHLTATTAATAATAAGAAGAAGAGASATARRPRSVREQTLSSFSKESTPPSDSGTEADDEHFLKRLPAPKVRLHKGLRGKNESLSGSSTPLLSPAALEEEGRQISNLSLKRDVFIEKDKHTAAERVRRRKELLRRFIEVALLVCQGGLLRSSPQVQPFLSSYRRELLAQCGLVLGLCALYPLRLVIWAYRRGPSSRIIPVTLTLPSSFDPAPILYPPIVPIYVSLLTAANAKSVVLPNLVLSICALPRSVVPTTLYGETYNSVHWALSCIPFLLSKHNATESSRSAQLPAETLVLLYPLHQTLCLILHHLTTTSLLTAELQLLSVALINVFLLSHSPQVLILKALLWGGGLGVIVFCGQVIRWGISLARVPKWRFRRATPSSGGFFSLRTARTLWPTWRSSQDVGPPEFDEVTCESGSSSDENYSGLRSLSFNPLATLRKLRRPGSIGGNETAPRSPLGGGAGIRFGSPQIASFRSSPRRHTLPTQSKPDAPSRAFTPSGRRKRSASSSVRAFFSLTQQQAAKRRWLYAGYVYVSVVAIILVGIRGYVQRVALLGNEPVGWALGYLFGDLPWFRLQVVKANLEKWVCLPPRAGDRQHPYSESCHAGWVQHLRHASIGEANTRLVLSAYFVGVIALGLAVVLQLSPIYEVDTRRKVFHFIMVAMFLPATFVDPAFVALALALMLAIFLLLDLLRASQLPPLSKPIAAFLTPYVDGRDLRGPVVISHIFLLIGCAIPLWLSLAALPRTGSGPWAGWEVPTRDASMVSGVVCVGLGDAAASLIGRRWGRSKWLWGGGKSLEGSAAFAAAVLAGLMAAAVWLRVGGWPVTAPPLSLSAAAVAGGGFANSLSISALLAWPWGATLRDAGVCASLASLTEAVLTGGNDNVVVPVVLWTCVKSTGI